MGERVYSAVRTTNLLRGRLARCRCEGIVVSRVGAQTREALRRTKCRVAMHLTRIRVSKAFFRFRSSGRLDQKSLARSYVASRLSLASDAVQRVKKFEDTRQPGVGLRVRMKMVEQLQHPRAVHIGELRRASSERIARAQHVDVQCRCQPVISE